jgi:hypothetical protein
MVEPVRHRQTKGAATDMFDLQPPRHTSTLPQAAIPDAWSAPRRDQAREFGRHRVMGNIERR